MLKDLLVPEELLQLDKLDSAIEISEGTSFLALLGVDSLELSKTYSERFNVGFRRFTPKTEHILDEILSIKKEFIVINLYENTNNEYIKNLLFYRDFIADYQLRIIFILNPAHYLEISKNAVDFYNVSSFAYMFTSYQIEMLKEVKNTELNQLIKDYQEKKRQLSKKQKVSFLIDLSKKYDLSGDIETSLKFLNEALKFSLQLKVLEGTIEIKYLLSRQYRLIGNYTVAEKYLLECEKFYRKRQTLNYHGVISSLSSLYIITRNKKSLTYCQKELDLALKTNNKDMELLALNNFSHYYQNTHEEIKETEYLNKTYSLAKKLNHEELLAELDHRQALRYIDLKKYDLAQQHLKAAQTFYKLQNDVLNINKTYMVFAQLYYSLHDYKKSLIYCDRAYQYFKKNNLKKEMLSITKLYFYNYQEERDLEKALIKVFEVLKLSKSLNLYYETFDALIHISQVHGMQEDYKSSLKYLDEALRLSKSTTINLILLYARYSDTYKNMNILDKAYAYYHLALKEMQKAKLHQHTAYLNELYAEILVKDNKLEEALKSFQETLDLAKESNDLARIMSLEENIAYLYKQTKNYPMAKKYFMEVITKIEVMERKDKKSNLLRDEIKLMAAL